MKNIGVMRRRPSVLLSRSLCHTLRSLKKKKGIPNDQKSLLIWDAFKAQSRANVFNVLSKHEMESVMVPKNMTHLFQPLGLTTNVSLKKIEKIAFSKYFSSSIMEVRKKNPTRDVTIIKVD